MSLITLISQLPHVLPLMGNNVEKCVSGVLHVNNSIIILKYNIASSPNRENTGSNSMTLESIGALVLRIERLSAV